MTVIAWDGKTLAADKRACNGTSITNTVTKIHRWIGGLCGFSGNPTRPGGRGFRRADAGA